MYLHLVEAVIELGMAHGPKMLIQKGSVYLAGLETLDRSLASSIILGLRRAILSFVVMLGLLSEWISSDKQILPHSRSGMATPVFAMTRAGVA